MIPLVEKELILQKRSRSKRERYRDIKHRVGGLLQQIYEDLENKSKYSDIIYRARDVAKDIDLEGKTDIALYTGLRFVLFFEGIDVGIVNKNKINYLTFKRVDIGEGLPPSIIKTLDNMELDGLNIRRDIEHLSSRHLIKKSEKKDENGENIYTLESEGNIYFDRRILTEEQALEFTKYMASSEMKGPDVVYNTPINIVLSDRSVSRYTGIDFNKLGREFRVIRSGDGGGDGDVFTIFSIYGKECTIHEFEVDSLIKGCSIYSIIYGFDKLMMEEKVPERIEILKKIIPEIKFIPDIKTKNIIMMDEEKLIVFNSAGTFQIYLLDGSLHKVKENGSQHYVCVGPIGNGENSIIYNGINYEIDRITASIIAKAIMLLEENYPDNRTKLQIMS